MSDPLDTAELFHIDVDHATRRIVLVALDGGLGFEVVEAAEADAAQDGAHG